MDAKWTIVAAGAALGIASLALQFRANQTSSRGTMIAAIMCHAGMWGATVLVWLL